VMRARSSEEHSGFFSTRDCLLCAALRKVSRHRDFSAPPHTSYCSTATSNCGGRKALLIESGPTFQPRLQ